VPFHMSLKANMDSRRQPVCPHEYIYNDIHAFSWFSYLHSNHNQVYKIIYTEIWIINKRD